MAGRAGGEQQPLLPNSATSIAGPEKSLAGFTLGLRVVLAFLTLFSVWEIADLCVELAAREDGWLMTIYYVGIFVVAGILLLLLLWLVPEDKRGQVWTTLSAVLALIAMVGAWGALCLTILEVAHQRKTRLQIHVVLGLLMLAANWAFYSSTGHNAFLDMMGMTAPAPAGKS